jgi:hypothetical protein
VQSPHRMCRLHAELRFSCSLVSTVVPVVGVLSVPFSVTGNVQAEENELIRYVFWGTTPVRNYSTVWNGGLVVGILQGAVLNHLHLT